MDLQNVCGERIAKYHVFRGVQSFLQLRFDFSIFFEVSQHVLAQWSKIIFL